MTSLKLPPLSPDDVFELIRRPDWAVYIYFGNETDPGWAIALYIANLFARIQPILCTSKVMARELRDDPSFAAVVWGLGSKPEAVGLTQSQASKSRTVKETVLELVS